MKQADKIWDVFDNGSYVGNRRSHARVTVEPDWFLHKTDQSYANSKRGPFRWYQNIDNTQQETEIPFIKNITIDRSIDTDIASCEISLYNQYMNLNGELPDLPQQLGKPGYFTWSHGRSEEAAARWNQTTNNWENVLIPNALLRTYQGFGGFNTDGSPMQIDDAVSEGYLTLTGVWLIDTVTVDSKGMMNLRCRDVGKLLQVQQYFMGLVPSRYYLTQFCRWSYKNFDASFNPRLPIVTQQVQEISPRYVDSAGDRWFGAGAEIHGHKGTDSTDGNLDTFALSPGSYNPTKLYACDWFEYEVNGQLNEVFIHPWAGNYTMYVSVFENGAWSDGDVVPYDPAELYGHQPIVVNTFAAIPYVMKTGVPWEEGRWYELPRTYNAERVRITFRDHALSEWGPWYYRCGIREIRIRVNTSATSPPAVPSVYSMATYHDPTVPFEAGYWAVADDGQIFAFGDARQYIKNDSAPINDQVWCIRPTSSGKGYYTLQANGVVHSYGDAVHHGDYYSSISTTSHAFIDMAITKTNGGYWLLTKSAEVYAFGDAVFYGNGAPFTSPTDRGYAGTGIESHPTLDGYWLLDGNGEVQAFGSLPNYGGITPFRSGMMPDEWTRGIKRNQDGSGYWILTGTGDLFAKGAARDFGQIMWPEFSGNPNFRTVFSGLTYDLALTSDDTGLYVIQANGHIEGIGDYDYFGEPGQQGMVRSNGNYTDYSDIVKLLLAWSGFLYYTTGDSIDMTGAADIPPVYGNIESTGAYADECISLGQFDKKTITDCINTLKELVGFCAYVDDEGGFQFHSPNWWSIGNFWNDGTPTDFIPEIDERTVLTDYSVNYSDETVRSEIIISTEDPTKANDSTVTTRLVPPTAGLLRGIEKPAMWINGVFKNVDEQRIMAELIGMHIWFQQRIGHVTCLANPCITIDDQVRIFERTTSETYVHYVRGMSSQHDLDSGVYTMTLTTHWLGDESNWVITKDAIPSGSNPLDVLPISSELVDWLSKVDSRTLTVARLNDFGSIPESTVISTQQPTDPNGIGGYASL